MFLPIRFFLKCFFILLLIPQIACVQQLKEDEKKVLVVREMADAASLNPVFSGGELANIIGLHLFQSLIGIDYRTEEVVGILAKAPAVQEKDSLGRLLLHYEIRPEAEFDNGRPILAEDVLFSLKLNILPHYSQANGVYYYGFIEDFKIDHNDPRKFTIVCQNDQKRNQFASGDFAILPHEVYDSNRVLKPYDLSDLLKKDSIIKDKKLVEFAKEFENNSHAVEKKFIRGTGPYRLKNWEKGQYLTLEKKENWWGKKLRSNVFFIANMPQIRYEIINDPITALTALKSKQIDLMRSIPSKDFIGLKQNVSAKQNISFKSKATFSYQYLGFNTKNILLQDPSIRRAIALAVPKKQLIETVFYNQAEPIYGPFSPLRNFFNSKFLSDLGYDLIQSKTLLKQSKCIDYDNDGILEKAFKQDTLPLKLSYHFNAGNEQRKAVGIILQNELKKIGIELEVQAVEWSVYLQGLRNGDFELFYGGVVSLPINLNFSSLFHSASALGGRNYANYQNPEVDRLLEEIQITKDKNRQHKLIDQFSRKILQEVPYYFLLSPKENIAYNNALKNVHIYALRPNYWAAEIRWK